MNFSQEAKIQHVSKHFPCLPGKIANKPKNIPNLFNLTLLRIKQRKDLKLKVKTKSNIWSIQEMINPAGYSLPYMQIQKIKLKITKLLEKPENHLKFESINYWGNINTRGLAYYIIIGIPRNTNIRILGLEFWVSQKMKNWIKLKPVNCKMIQHAK